MALIVDHLRKEEGTVLHAYQDHLGYWTIGVGRLIDAKKGGGISEAEAEYLLMNDIAKVQLQLDDRIPWWRGLSEVRQCVLVSMAFQMGIGGLMSFKNTLGAIERGDWARAAAGMRASKWHTQTPARAGRLAAAMETDEVEALKL